MEKDVDVEKVIQKIETDHALRRRLWQALVRDDEFVGELAKALRKAARDGA